MEESSSVFSIIVILVCLSALLSGAETALLSLPESKIRAMKEKKTRWVKFLEYLKVNQKQVIITILLGSNTVNILIPTIGTLWVTAHYGDTPAKDIAMGISTFVLTFTILFFGEILPKHFAVTYNEKFALYVAPFLYFLTKTLAPLVWGFEKLSELVTPTRKNEGISEEEVLAMVSMSEEHGDITLKEKNRIENLLEFSDTQVQEVMTPRTKIQGLEDTTTLGEAREFFLKNTHSRIPVYTEDLDHITEIITLRDILDSSQDQSDEKMIKNLELRSPYFIPITKKISDLFEEFQRQRTHIAIVVDEHGGTAGLITMEDIFEEIFGDIQDETDNETQEILKIDETSWRVSSQMTAIELKEETGICLSEDENDDEIREKTLSLLILEKLGRFPRRGESIVFTKAILVIEKMGERSIESVRVVKK